jgi:hypothetical protein
MSDHPSKAGNVAFKGTLSWNEFGNAISNVAIADFEMIQPLLQWL